MTLAAIAHFEKVAKAQYKLDKLTAESKQFLGLPDEDLNEYVRITNAISDKWYYEEE